MSFPHYQLILYFLLFLALLTGCSLPHKYIDQDYIEKRDHNMTFSMHSELEKILYSQDTIGEVSLETLQNIINKREDFTDNSDDLIDNEESYYIFGEDDGINHKFAKS